MPATPRNAVSGVLLAAGAGTRLGLGPKALLPFRDRSLAEVLADTLHDGGCAEVVVVVGAEADKVAALPGLSSCRVVRNPHWADGMAGSFRAGLEAAAPGNDALLALVDQPGLGAEIVSRLIARHRPGRVTAAAYPDLSGTLRRGHPLIIDAALREQVAASAAGDAGARHFLKAHPGLVDLVDCGDLSDGGDVDTKADLHLLG
ncbi:molybdenum cofactor cytidylyltransferase [Arthrobacter sp. SW1]|uniref:nicotine blue oxidoreductase n=1 Tax=Arthrobacter sp. SW1 TaxID=1920889 RepID=UPI000877B5A8|nr:NTP transferase domain-containing protein [Arthrobacter sp. SW1]OFI37159.1 molybdenum cofactor cytidylyltransferase [Arthrobacter sp. SW1]